MYKMVHILSAEKKQDHLLLPLIGMSLPSSVMSVEDLYPEMLTKVQNIIEAF